MPRSDGTVTPTEHAVLELLRDGPALLGPRTAHYQARRLAGPDGIERVETVRVVDSATTRRLAHAGLVVIEHGEARLP